MDEQNTANEYLRAKRHLFDTLYDFMNEKQQRAVFAVNGPLLVLAGAGTGKTTVLVNRIGFILKYGNAYESNQVPADITKEQIAQIDTCAVSGDKEAMAACAQSFAQNVCPPWAVLAITFTNKAANEIKERLEKLVGADAGDIWSGTFHSICMRILRKYGDRVGYQTGFTIYDANDTKKLLSECLKQLNIDEKQLPIKSVANEIGRAKDKLLGPEEYTAAVGSDFRLGQIAVVYELYQKKLRDANALDFDDIIMQTVLLLRAEPEVCDYYQNHFRYVCVDEFQDTNDAQFVLTSLLSGKYHNLMVVGDDDQSIYKFRGATIENILHFDQTYPNARVIKLEQNYRSSKTILKAANAVIRNNFGRRGKELWCDNDAGEKIVVRKLDNALDEAKYIVDKIMELKIREKRRYGDFAVLYRTNAQSSALETVFVKSGIPYRMLGGTRFYDRKEVKDVLSYLCVINNPADDLRLKRIINEPKRKIGDTTVSNLQNIADYEGVSMFHAMKHAQAYPAIRSNHKLQEFVAVIDQLIDISKTEKLSVLFEQVLKLTGYRQMLINGGQAEAERLENVEELVSNAVQYETENPEATLSDFLEEISLVTDIDRYDQNADAVVFMTIHSAKGLEFPVVFLPGMEENLFPSERSMINPEELEEERRLAYVAITRAKDRLYATHTRERLQFGRTTFHPRSRFLDEIDESCIQQEYPRGAVPKAANTVEKTTEPQTGTRKNNVNISPEFFSPSDLSSYAGRTRSFDRFEVGDRVSHQAFGLGTVMGVKEMGADLLYEIAFDKVGTKKLMATYAKLRKIKND